MLIRAYRAGDEAGVVALWHACGLTRPWNDPHRDIARKVAEQPELFLIGTEGEELVATAMVGYDGHRGSVFYLGVAPRWRNRSFARQLMQEAERLLVARGCPKLNVLVRSGNTEVLVFYDKLGYARDEALSISRRLIPD